MAKIIGKPKADDVKRVAAAALVAALDDGKDHARKKPGLTGVRAVATGAVLYTAGKAALNGRRFINERLRSDDEEADEEEQEPEAQEQEDFEDDEERAAEEDEDLEDEEELEEEPVAEEDEDFEDEDYEDDDVEERSAASEPPVHPDDGDADVDEDELPPRPSRKRAPVGRR